SRRKVLFSSRRGDTRILEVTGVQTCALLLWRNGVLQRRNAVLSRRNGVLHRRSAILSKPRKVTDDKPNGSDGGAARLRWVGRILEDGWIQRMPDGCPR
ncbi:MAG: hypothetical protein KDK97_08950, partial [Verrucomicrobiales bacterium]|nr:hypothetical protein [Verrucomicrobiales bacterium]